jgi:hypothetical protein
MHLALFIPSAPISSALISYAAAIAPLLAANHRVTLVMDAIEGDDGARVRALFPDGMAAEPYADYCERGAPCDLALYSFGDRDRLNGFVFEAARRAPGIAILHDTVLHQGLLHDPLLARDAIYCRRELAAVYGDAGEQLTARVLAGQARQVFRHYPATVPVIDGSLALIAPSEPVAAEVASRHRLQAVRYIPSPGPEPGQCCHSSRQALRQALGLAAAPLIVVPLPPDDEDDILMLRTALRHLNVAWPALRTLVCDHGRLSENPAWRHVGPAERLWKMDRLSDHRRSEFVAAADVAVVFASPDGRLDPTAMVRLVALGTPIVAVGPVALQPSLRHAVAPVYREDAQPWAALRAAVHYYLSNSRAAQAAARAGRRLVERDHSPARIQHALDDLLQETLAQRPALLAAARARGVSRPGRLTGRSELSSLTGRALAELGLSPREHALLLPLERLIESLTPERLPEPPCLDA